MAARPAKPAGEIVLDAAHPVIAADLGGVPLRLRVDLAQWDSVELNPDAAARLPLRWAPGRDLAVGRTTVWGRTAETRLTIAGATRPILVASHDRVATADADGVIGPDILPWLTIRWRRTDAPPDTGTIVLPLTISDETGIEAALPALAPDLTLHVSLQAAVSSATAAAGALLAARFGGRFDGPAAPFPVILGVTRPARPIAFARPFTAAGFRIDRLPVRTSDFRGDNPLPQEESAAADIVVSRRVRPQEGRPWIVLGLDRLSACAEIAYAALPRTLTLRCAFDER